ncbi:solute carrier family 22 member 6-A-like [Lissotriton helveticus]
MAFGDLLDLIGGMGRFQIIHVALLSIPIMLTPIHNLVQNFLAAVPEHHCQIYQAYNASGDLNLTQTLSTEDLLKVSIPLDSKGAPEQCLRYSVLQWDLLAPNATATNKTGMSVEPCNDGWTFDTSEFSSTIVSQWNLVCEQHPLKQLALSIYMTGVLVGGAVIGLLSDRFGRRRLIMWSYLQLAVSGTCTAFSPNFISYCVFRFLVGMANSGVVLSTVSLVLEWVPTRARTMTGTFTGYLATLGQILLAGLAYAIRDWRWLQLALSLPFFIFFLYSWWYAESARWLIMSGKPEHAVKELRKVARINGKLEECQKLNIEMLKSSMQKELAAQKTSYSVLDIVRTPMLRRISFCLGLVWFSTAFAYYGLATDLQSFGLSIYLVQVTFGSVDIPCKAISVLTMSFIGRRAAQACSLSLAGIIIMAGIFVPTEMQVLRASLAVLGKGCLAASFVCCYLFSGELYPTMLRQTGMGLCNTMARIGGIVAPLVQLTGEYFRFLPLVIYACAPIISGIAACFLPETLNVALPDSIEEVENRGRRKNDEEQQEFIPLPSARHMTDEADKK